MEKKVELWDSKVLAAALGRAVESIKYNQRVEAYEAMGMTRSDAQGVVDAEDLSRGKEEE
jgi:hypothetical protein